jgi:hypothetical protein
MNLLRRLFYLPPELRPEACGLAFGAACALGFVACLAPGQAQTASNAALTTEQVICLTADMAEVVLDGTDPELAHDLSIACGISQALEPDVSKLLSQFQAKRAAIRAARARR